VGARGSRRAREGVGGEKEVRVVGEGVVGEVKKAEPDTAQRRGSEAGKPLAWEKEKSG